MPPIWPILVESGKLQRSQNFKDLSARIRGSWRFSLGIFPSSHGGKTVHTAHLPSVAAYEQLSHKNKTTLLADLHHPTQVKSYFSNRFVIIKYTENLMDRQNNTLRLPICTLWCSNLWKSFFETNWKTDLNSQSAKRKACVTFGIFR